MNIGMNVGIYIYHGAEMLDFSGPFEVFSTASRLANQLNNQGFNVYLIAETLSPVNARSGFSVNPHYSINDHPELDVLIVSGGQHQSQLQNTALMQWLNTVNQHTEIVASVCTGAFLLAEANLLSTQKVTTHWEDASALQQSNPSLNISPQSRWIQDGKFITSAGISAGIDMSLHLVAQLTDHSLAEKTAKQMDYHWQQ